MLIGILDALQSQTLKLRIFVISWMIKNLHATRDLRNPGSSGNILDLVLTNNDFLVEDEVVHPRAFNSDHHPITFKFHAEMRRPINIQRKVYCYKKADLKGLQETSQSVPWNLVTCDNCIDTGLIKFQDLLFAAVNQHIPRISLKRRSRPPWICNDIMKLIRKKRKLWKQVKSNGSPDIFLKFKELRKKTKRLINTSYHNYLQSLSGKLQDSPKHFWTFYSVKSKTKRIPDSVIYDNVCSTDASSKAELFNKFFHSIYSEDSADVVGLTTDVVNPNLLLQHLKCREFYVSLTSINHLAWIIYHQEFCKSVRGIVGSLVTLV